MRPLNPHRHRPPGHPHPDHLNAEEILERNIRTMIDYHRQEEEKKSIRDRIADALTAFSGSMMFVYLHAIWFGAWIIFNLGWFHLQPFDPFPFGLLTMIVSLEAIFLSTFVLISQNRAGAVADKRADLDLQIDLFAEHEITRLITMVDAIATHLGVEPLKNPELGDLKKDVMPMHVLEKIKSLNDQAREAARHHQDQTDQSHIESGI
ncbi:MAG TPA: DUF1003 domain-containing protein [Blastocatellia bacterium]|nr:DUF1003 domain-containing protein [Blastocatellia bacterium]